MHIWHFRASFSCYTTINKCKIKPSHSLKASRYVNLVSACREALAILYLSQWVLFSVSRNTFVSHLTCIGYTCMIYRQETQVRWLRSRWWRLTVAHRQTHISMSRTSSLHMSGTSGNCVAKPSNSWVLCSRPCWLIASLLSICVSLLVMPCSKEPSLLL